MSKNEDLKEKLQKNFDSFFQYEDEEKLSKELKDNLEKFFKVINDKYGKDFHLNDGANKFLEEFSPWHQERGKKLIEDFEEIVNQNSTEDFSWLDILEKDEQWKKSWEKSNKEVQLKEEVTDKNKHVNMRYQIPTHFHGDIDNAVIFHCMENPRGYLGEYEDSYIDKELGGSDLEEYFGKTYKLLNEDNSSNKSIKEIIKERYQLGEGKLDITNIIYSDKSNLSRELDKLFLEGEDFFEKEYNLKKNKNNKKPVLSEKYYYLAQYYAKLLKIDGKNMRKLKDKPGDENTEGRKKARKISKKICNLEIYPFSCKDPKLGNDGIGKKILRHSDLSRLGAYIVLRRIYKYLLKCDQSKTNNEEEPQKPVFVFRKYDRAWEGLFNSIFEEAEKEENNDGFQNEQTLKNLEKLFFYCQTGQQGGGITSGNVISIKNYKIYKDIFETLKQTAFKEISDILRRGDIDKNSSGKSGD